MGGKRVEKGGGNAVVMADGFKEGLCGGGSQKRAREDQAVRVG